jgi:quercetin dioxygenase-like cupin family protein
MENILTTAFLNGKVFNHETKDIDELAWNKHKVFNGVYLKHLITGTETGNKFSCHIVKVDPGCTLENHIHEGKWETHEVIDGQGRAFIGNDSLEYKPGVLAVIPENITHKVCADNTGLVLFAKFIPALL